ncbi:MAG: glycosyltransferase [Candidatus Polarisedimenticolaceae bacterium]|nr:glycosyltransferase [Candidatus Polarisedimenticolaceae bacterium]
MIEKMHQLKVGYVTASVSRQAGGLFGAVCGLAKAVNCSDKINLQTFSLRDACSDKDADNWKVIKPHLFDVWGSSAIGYAPDMLPAMEAEKLDLLHTHGVWMYPSVASYQWAQRCGRPYLISAHGMLDTWALQNSKWKKQMAGWLYEVSHLKGAACLHALCESEAMSYRAFGLHNPICVIPNGIDLPFGKRAAFSPWEGRLPVGSKVLLFLGRLHPKKGIEQLIKAWSLACKADNCLSHDWRLVVTGWDDGGGYEAVLRSLTDELNATAQVLFTGPLFGSEKQAALDFADAFVLPSLSEGLPMAPLEAWASGMPVIMTEQCNLPEGFAHEAAIRIEPETASIMRALLLLFSMSEDELKDMGLRGQQLVQERFTWDRVGAEMCQVYDWISGDSLKPSCVLES